VKRESSCGWKKLCHSSHFTCYCHPSKQV